MTYMERLELGCQVGFIVVVYFELVRPMLADAKDFVHDNSKRLYRRYFTKKYCTPWRCVFFGHLWKESGHKVGMSIPMMLSLLEVCQKCGEGRSADLNGWKCYNPKTITDFLAQEDGIEKGQILALHRDD